MRTNKLSFLITCEMMFHGVSDRLTTNPILNLSQIKIAKFSNDKHVGYSGCVAYCNLVTTTTSVKQRGPVGKGEQQQPHLSVLTNDLSSLFVR